jgi:2-polyprenyl-6-methoxyphenol hydroxylase-like FAD-dependent oxidoreductase
MLPSSTDVLIVGAGPTGLARATTLAQEGVDFVVLDKLQQSQNTSRAAVIHAHTLDVLQRIGVSEQLAAQGLKIVKFGVHDRDRSLIQTRFDDLPTPHPFLLMLAQDVTEKVLADRLAAVRGLVRRGCQVEDVVQDADGATANVVSEDGRRTLVAKYVVGADGMHSVVRAAAGIRFTGESYELSFILADVTMSWGHGAEEVRLFFSPAGLVVVAPLPNGTFRIVATVDHAPEHPSGGDVQALLDTRGPTQGAARIEEVVWGSRFRLHHRLADAYRKDRLFLVGDAAHVHSPAGGQGMNTGLVDACVLGDILTNVLAGRRGADLLDTYQELRRPAAADVLRLAGRLTRAATLQGSKRRAARNALLSFAGHFPAIRRRIAMDLSGLSRASAAVLPM